MEAKNQVINVARKGAPWPVLAVIGLIIAKMGFGVQISWLWVLAPLWIVPAFLLSIAIAVALVAGLIFALWLLYKGAEEAIRRRNAKPRLV